MFKKLILALLIGATVLWGTGFDFVAFKDRLVKAQKHQADGLTGRSSLDKSDWGPNA